MNKSFGNNESYELIDRGEVSVEYSLIIGQETKNNRNLEKILHLIIKNIAASISFMSVLFLTIGWFFSFIYFVHIGYFPSLDINSSVSFFSAIALLGIFIFLFYCLLLVSPVPLWFYFYGSILKRNPCQGSCKRDFFVSLLLNFSLLISFVIGIVGNNIGEWQGNIYISLSVLLSVTGVSVFMVFSSKPIKGTIRQKIMRKALILFVGLQSIFPGVFYCCVFALMLVTIDKIPYEHDMRDFVRGTIALFIFIFFANLYFFEFWSNRRDKKNIEKIVPLLLIAFFVVSSLYVLGGSNSISYASMRKLRLGALTDSTIIVNYQGCKIFEEIDDDILKDSVNYGPSQLSKTICIEGETFSAKKIDIQVAIGETLFLKYPSDKYILGKKAECHSQKCVTVHEKKFEFPKKYVLSYFLPGEERRLRKP